eukprot:12884999-Prorocentrum_lima.AAC.1
MACQRRQCIWMVTGVPAMSSAGPPVPCQAQGPRCWHLLIAQGTAAAFAFPTFTTTVVAPPN